MLPTATGLLIGCMLGARFTVFALIPVLILASCIALASLLLSQLIVGTLVELGVLCAALQAGYLISACIRFAARSGRHFDQGPASVLKRVTQVVIAALDLPKKAVD